MHLPTALRTQPSQGEDSSGLITPVTSAIYTGVVITPCITRGFPHLFFQNPTIFSNVPIVFFGKLLVKMLGYKYDYPKTKQKTSGWRGCVFSICFFHPFDHGVFHQFFASQRPSCHPKNWRMWEHPRKKHKKVSSENGFFEMNLLSAPSFLTSGKFLRFLNWNFETSENYDHLEGFGNWKKRALDNKKEMSMWVRRKTLLSPYISSK